MADVIIAYFSDGSKWGVNIDYSVENDELGTMGPLNLIKDLPEDFLVMNGDVMTNLDFSDFYSAHLRSLNLFTICAANHKTKVDFGVLIEDENSYLVGFDEKPLINHIVSMGIYMLNKSVLDYIPSKMLYGFDSLMYKLIQEKVNPKIYKFDGYWLDIGRPSDYEKAIEDILKIENAK
jgi:NDP-sugar pyrophosphorylase family protein